MKTEMITKLLILLTIVSAAFPTFAQTENVDSLSISPCPDSTAVSGYIGIKAGGDSLTTFILPKNDSCFNYKSYQPMDLYVGNLTLNPGQASILRWRNGEIVASGATAFYPGLMQVDSGTIGVYQSTGNLDFYAGGIVNKYGYFRGVHTQYGIRGEATWHFSPNVSFTAFGTYYFDRTPTMRGGLLMPPAMAGFYEVSELGGYVNYDTGGHIGVLVGGRAVQQIGTQRYRPEPILTPYVVLGSGKKKFAVGLPVGQILYGIFGK